MSDEPQHLESLHPRTNAQIFDVLGKTDILNIILSKLPLASCVALGCAHCRSE